MLKVIVFTIAHCVKIATSAGRKKFIICLKYIYKKNICRCLAIALFGASGNLLTLLALPWASR